jgi:hypothetical protein
LLMAIGVGAAIGATGLGLMAALAVAMASIYGQATVSEVVLARYTADVWRGRIYSVRYFLTFLSSGVGVYAIAFLYARGGFSLVLGMTAAVALAFFIAAAAIAVLAHRIERDHARRR